MDNDGDLDVVVTNNSNFKNSETWFERIRNLSIEDKANISVKLFRNDGNKFTDISKISGVQVPNFGLGILTQDFNDDGWIDIYIANDYLLPDYYFINQKNGSFKDMSKAFITQTSFFSMGTDASDFNNDGILDIATVDMTPSDHVRNKVLMESMDVEQFRFLKNSMGFNDQYMFNTFQIGVGEGHFSEIGKQLGISQTGWSWSSLIFDIDNDGLKDYYISNGYYKDTKNNDFQIKAKILIDSLGSITHPDAFAIADTILDRTPLFNKVYKNINGEKFQEKSSWSNMSPSFSNGAAYGDLDNDGDLDMVINNLGETATLLRNNSNSNFIRFKLVNNGNICSHTNAKFVIHHNGKSQRNDHFFTRGYFSYVEPIVHFGLGDNQQVDSLEIFWIDGTKTVLKNLDTKKLHEIDLAKVKKQNIHVAENEYIFSSISNRITPPFKHQENEFDDFRKEVLLPHKYSTMGPCISVADVDNDGFEDFYIGGAKGQAGKIYKQHYGQFQPSENDFSIHANYEDLGSLFFDADQDGDLDLYVASGGGGDVHNENMCQDRLYLNDGTGNFSYKQDALPKISSSTKSVKPLDYDLDGDLDLIVGGRNMPGKYPLDSESYFLQNNKGVFKNVTSSTIKNELDGMVTDITPIDIDADNDLDLIVVGEWSSPKLLINDKGHYEKKQIASLDSLSGWWQCIKAFDMDADGDLDFVLGNIGENNKFHPSASKPLGVLASDFDESGTLDIVLTKHYKDKIVPVRGKECSSEQMPFISEKFPTYTGFATSSVDQILGKENIQKANRKEVNFFSSALVINEGNLNFVVKPLCFESQWSPILNVQVDDFNGDNLLDILASGNIHNTEPETPAYDGGKGLLLLGNSDGTFVPQYKVQNTGLILSKNVKAVEPIKIVARKKGLLIANNNDIIELYEVNN